MTNTPGPWEYHGEEGQNFIVTAADGTFVINGCGCCASPWCHSEADARLITAAPNMKEVLKTIAEMNPYDTSSMEYVVSLAKSAIEKVTGGAV